MMHTTQRRGGGQPQGRAEGDSAPSSITGTDDTQEEQQVLPQVVEVIHSKSSNCNTSSVHL